MAKESRARSRKKKTRQDRQEVRLSKEKTQQQLTTPPFRQDCKATERVYPPPAKTKVPAGDKDRKTKAATLASHERSMYCSKINKLSK
jgi:hypothetical protein